jgi:hypothetical protein
MQAGFASNLGIGSEKKNANTPFSCLGAKKILTENIFMVN